MLQPPPSSEARIEVQLQDVHLVVRAVDLVAGVVAEPRPDVVRETQVSAHEVALRIGATLVEVRVCQRVQHRIALDVAVAQCAAPVPAFEHVGIAKGQLHLIAVPARIGLITKEIVDLPAVEADVADTLRIQGERVLVYRQYVAGRDLGDAELRAEAEDRVGAGRIILDVAI